MKEIIGQTITAGLILALVLLVAREYMRQQGWRGRQLARFVFEPRYMIVRLNRQFYRLKVAR